MFYFTISANSAPGFEFHHFFGWNGDFFSGLGIAAFASFSGGYRIRTESYQ
jgi:hypothetical protein